jgi:glycosyltransferase involved in cell wall biosynthesis
MEIVYATDVKATNIHNWSGLAWYYRKMLEQAGCDVTLIDSSEMPHPFHYDLKKHLTNKLSQRFYSPRFSVAVAKYYANRIHEKVAPGSVILSPNTVVLSYLKKEFKKVLYADATFDSLLNLYPRYNRLTKQCLKEAEAIDQQAISNADLLIYTSQWAADSAIKHYGANPSKIRIVPFGANLDTFPSYGEVRNSIFKRMRTGHINLLFLGIDWERKGGEYALDVVAKLNKLGFPATLHVVGVKDLPPHPGQSYLVNHHFISKATPEGQQQLSALLASSHFLLLPTLADCTPVACSEASAFGVPCLTSDVGGLKSIIKNELNGHAFALNNFVNDAVAYIINLMENKPVYEELCHSAYNMYETELNWRTIGHKIVRLIKDM